MPFTKEGVPGFAIDNFTIKKNGTVIFSTDFSDSALPAGLTLGNRTLNSSSSLAIRSGSHPGKDIWYFSVKSRMYLAIAL